MVEMVDMGLIGQQVDNFQLAYEIPLLKDSKIMLENLKLDNSDLVVSLDEFGYVLGYLKFIGLILSIDQLELVYD